MQRSAINPMPEFFDRYINLVDDVDIFEAFNRYSPVRIISNFTKLAELGDRVYEPGKWTVKDILQHIIDNERIMSYRALRFARNDATALPGYDQELLAAHTNAINRSLDELFEEFKQVRITSLMLFKSMDGKMMLRSGIASNSQISSLALGFVIIGHAIHHMKVIEDRYFPLLGEWSNTFSDNIFIH
jgi:hypothetical protein